MYCTLFYLLAGEFIGPYALHEGDGMWVELVGRVGLVDYGKRHPETKPLQVAHLYTFTMSFTMYMYIHVQQS